MTSPFIQSSAELLKSYKKHIWQPFTQMKLMPSTIFIERAKGVYLYTQEGQEIIDAIGSWWVNIHGHNHPYINQKIQEQLEKVEHVIFSGLCHEAAIEVASALSLSTNHGLPKVFFSDNGSTGVEIALKMAYQYFYNQGKKNQKEKKEFITLEGSYHGDTVGAMSVGGRSSFHDTFEHLLFPCHQLPAPSISYKEELSQKNFTQDFTQDITEHNTEHNTIKALETLLEQRSQYICALIIEPIIQGAGAPFRFYSASYLKK